jgi:hypothetical protein
VPLKLAARIVAASARDLIRCLSAFDHSRQI